MTTRHALLSARLAAFVLLLLAPAAARAQAKFQFEKPASVTATTWAARTQLGTTLSTGNTEALGVSGQATVSRTDRRNRIALGPTSGSRAPA